ncbi:hypothetical protein [Bradyrhizobium glycinis]|uniref:hypothetical protein n=1 Tax=Bradyrhizobium glycinis TaxID=2751812 RepID=UPI0018D61DA7|nr:hypothetical protein [Bradyrhizobium glycinis]MBH5372247.1 hypothetical protein [Bradyrhizobium glycinis]
MVVGSSERLALLVSGGPLGFPLPVAAVFGYAVDCAVVVEARPSDLYLTETTTIIVFGPLLVLVGISFFCSLLFTFAVFALPFFVGLTIGTWAFHTGAGVLGGVAAGLMAGWSRVLEHPMQKHTISAVVRLTVDQSRSSTDMEELAGLFGRAMTAFMAINEGRRLQKPKPGGGP